jgi:hypothetical protein
MSDTDQQPAFEEPCGCGLWICKDCRPDRGGTEMTDTDRQRDAIDNTIASARLSGIEATSDDRERMERLRSTIRGRKALYEGLANMPSPTDPHGTGCGCEWRGGRPFRCDFHQGYEEGRAVSNQIIMEMQAKLDHANGRISRDVMLDRIMEARDVPTSFPTTNPQKAPTQSDDMTRPERLP